MDNIILEFLEAYKSLDELCRQILASERGVSEYIDEMDKETQGYRMVSCWENDYKRLKKMRWKRNRLVHETSSFEEEFINAGDVEWLKTFYLRIMECTDPFSLLNQSKNTNRKTENQEKLSGEYYRTIVKKKTSENNNQIKGASHNWNLYIRFIIILGIIMMGILIFVTIFDVIF